MKKEKDTNSKDAILLLAHDTPDVLGEMAEYFKFVTGGRGVTPNVAMSFRSGMPQSDLGDTPTEEDPHLTRWTLRQAAQLRARLNSPVYVGMRNWNPFISDVVDQMRTMVSRGLERSVLHPRTHVRALACSSER